MFHTALRIVVILSLTIACADAVQPKAAMFDTRDSTQYKELNRHVIYMERPVYPISARIRRKTGSGLFWMHFDKSGRVTAVKILESTKQPELDNAAVYAFYRWRCRPGQVYEAIIPVTFTMQGPHSGVGGHAY
jgi:TonB family protein